MNKLLTFISILSLCLITGTQVGAQSKENLQKEILRLQKEISSINRLMNDTDKSAQLSTSQLQSLQNKIQIRSNLIGNISREISLLDKQIDARGEHIHSLGVELDTLKGRYARMCIHYYDNAADQKRLIYLLSSKNFLQAYKRRQYIQQYAEWIHQQGDSITSKKEQIATYLASLKKDRQSKSTLVSQKENEVSTLEKDRTQEQIILAGLQNKKKQLEADLKKKQLATRKIEQEIARIVQEEIRQKELAEARAKAKGAAAQNAQNKINAEIKALSTNFTANKGKLPWPVSDGVVYSRFGKQPYPGLKNVYTDNPGIVIATPKDATARSCFEGEVSRVQVIPGANYVVYIRHGQYYTVYGNLEKVLVKQGDKVKTAQQIGTIYTDAAENKTLLNFMIFLSAQKLNPEPWLVK